VKIDGPAIPDLIATWRRIGSCAPPAQTVDGVVSISVARCPQGRAVELVTVAGAGHQWPGARGPGAAAAELLHLDPPSNAVDATSTIWQFFAAHQR
jgi:polyhydroxybutyrate depolymerase